MHALANQTVATKQPRYKNPKQYESKSFQGVFIPVEFLESFESPYEIAAFVALHVYMNANSGEATPSVRTLAQTARMGKTKATEVLAKLSDTGWVERVRRRYYSKASGKNRNTTNKYAVRRPDRAKVESPCPRGGLSSTKETPDKCPRDGQQEHTNFKNKTSLEQQQDNVVVLGDINVVLDLWKKHFGDDISKRTAQDFLSDAKAIGKGMRYVEEKIAGVSANRTRYKSIVPSVRAAIKQDWVWESDRHSLSATTGEVQDKYAMISAALNGHVAKEEIIEDVEVVQTGTDRREAVLVESARSSMTQEHASSVWKAALVIAERRLAKPTFETWWRGKTEAIGIVFDTLIVAVPDEFTRDWLSNKYIEHAKGFAGIPVRFVKP